jgi:hypothetical protein
MSTISSPLSSIRADRRSAEIAARERHLASRAEALRALESRLAASGKRLERLEQRLHEAKAQPRPPVTLRRTLPTLPPSYFQPSTTWDDEAWWSKQLGKAAASAA